MCLFTCKVKNTPHTTETTNIHRHTPTNTPPRTSADTPEASDPGRGAPTTGEIKSRVKYFTSEGWGVGFRAVVTLFVP